MSLMVVLSVEEEPVYGVRAAIDALRPDQCKWPISLPALPDFHFCAGDRVAGRPYCAFHLRLNRRVVVVPDGK